MEKDILKILNKISKRSKIKESTNIIKSKIFDSLDLINLILLIIWDSKSAILYYIYY